MRPTNGSTAAGRCCRAPQCGQKSPPTSESPQDTHSNRSINLRRAPHRATVDSTLRRTFGQGGAGASSGSDVVTAAGSDQATLDFVAQRDRREEHLLDV